MKDDILESILREINLRATNTPDVEDVATRDFKRGRVSGRVEIFFRSRMSTNHPRQLVGKVDPYVWVRQAK